METETKKPKTETVKIAKENKFSAKYSEYENVSQVRSLKNNGEPVSAETEKMYKLLMEALADETKN